MIGVDHQLVSDARSLGMTQLEAKWLAVQAINRARYEVDERGVMTAVGVIDCERGAFWEALATHLPEDD